MPVNIDTVYQKVLTLTSKEQRGYLTPQELNLIADKAQSEIFDNYFHDMKTAFYKSKTDKTHADDMELIKARILIKKKIIGITCHNSIKLAKLADKDGADYWTNDGMSLVRFDGMEKVNPSEFKTLQRAGVYVNGKNLMFNYKKGE